MSIDADQYTSSFTCEGGGVSIPQKNEDSLRHVFVSVGNQLLQVIHIQRRSQQISLVCLRKVPTPNRHHVQKWWVCNIGNRTYRSVCFLRFHHQSRLRFFSSMGLQIVLQEWLDVPYLVEDCPDIHARSQTVSFVLEEGNTEEIKWQLPAWCASFVRVSLDGWILTC